MGNDGYKAEFNLMGIPHIAKTVRLLDKVQRWGKAMERWQARQMSGKPPRLGRKLSRTKRKKANAKTRGSK